MNSCHFWNKNKKYATKKNISSFQRILWSFYYVSRLRNFYVRFFTHSVIHCRKYFYTFLVFHQDLDLNLNLVAFQRSSICRYVREHSKLFVNMKIQWNNVHFRLFPNMVIVVFFSCSTKFSSIKIWFFFSGSKWRQRVEWCLATKGNFAPKAEGERNHRRRYCRNVRIDHSGQDQ